MIKNWKIKLVFPILYFFAALVIFYIVTVENKFNLNGMQKMGIIVSLVSFILWIVSRVQLAHSFSITAQATKLVNSGIYSRIRHPVYIFSFFAIVGVLLFLQRSTLFFLLIPLGILQIVRAHQEEKILMEEFGEAYLRYKETTWF